jgi:hypothetical protein
MNPTVECDVTIGDFNAFTNFLRRHAYRTSSANFWMLVVGIPFGIGGGILAARTGVGDYGPMPLLLGFVSGVVFLYIAALAYAPILRKRLQPTPDGYMLAKQRYELRADGFHVRTKKHEALFHWDIVAPPIERDGHYFVMVERAAAIIIPKRCFTNEAEGNAFAENIRSLAKHEPY